MKYKSADDRLIKVGDAYKYWRDKAQTVTDLGNAKILRNMLDEVPSAQPEKSEKETVKELYNILKDLCENIRERYGQDDVCGLCQYDADHGLDGYANECPGFEREDCFCMKNEIRRMCGIETVPEPE